MIVKIQRALSGTPSLLIYDKPQILNGAEYHEIFAQIPSSAQEISAILGDDLKGYFETDTDADAELEDGKLIIGKRVPDQDW